MVCISICPKLSSIWFPFEQFYDEWMVNGVRGKHIYIKVFGESFHCCISVVFSLLQLKICPCGPPLYGRTGSAYIKGHLYTCYREMPFPQHAPLYCAYPTPSLN